MRSRMLGELSNPAHPALAACETWACSLELSLAAQDSLGVGCAAFVIYKISAFAED